MAKGDVENGTFVARFVGVSNEPGWNATGATGERVLFAVHGLRAYGEGLVRRDASGDGDAGGSSASGVSLASVKVSFLSSLPSSSMDEEAGGSRPV